MDIIQLCQAGVLMSDNNFTKEYLTAFGKSLKNIRIHSAQKSLRLFAYEADIPCATLSRLENGSRIANIITLKKFAAALNWSVSSLLSEIEKDIPDNIKNSEL